MIDGSVTVSVALAALALLAYASGAGQLMRIVQPEPRWLTATIDDGAYPIVIQVRPALPLGAKRSHYPHLLTVRWDYRPQSDLFPFPEEHKLMAAFEDVLSTTLRRPRVGFLMAVVTGNGKQEWLCYGRDLGEATAAIQGELAQAKSVSARISSRRDPDWSEHEMLRQSVEGRTEAQGQSPGLLPVF